MWKYPGVTTRITAPSWPPCAATSVAEIWAPATWADYRRAMDDPEAFAKAIQGLGI